MNPWIITAIILVIIIAALAFLYYRGNKMQKEQAEQREKLEQAAQQTTMLVIDKKRMPLQDAGLPQIVIDQTPKRARRAKVPVVKAKVGPRVMTLIADEDIFDEIPVKAQIKAMVSGIYITGIKNYRKTPVAAPEKKGFMARVRRTLHKAQNELDETKKQEEKEKAKKAAKNKKKK
ncbi:MAG: hypothetical protein LUF92_17985 [Clostridiales bacterium]|nr:hypothetical protein [Clostridiales bacterium]